MGCGKILHSRADRDRRCKWYVNRSECDDAHISHVVDLLRWERIRRSAAEVSEWEDLFGAWNMWEGMQFRYRKGARPFLDTIFCEGVASTVRTPENPLRCMFQERGFERRASAEV